MTLTAYQREARDRRDLGLWLALWRRQGGKTTYFALLALRTMAAIRGILVTFASASLLVGREVTMREAVLYRDLVRLYVEQMRGSKIESIDCGNGLRPEREDDFAEAFAAGRLETRLWHDRTTFSRTQVIAPNPATARGFSGHVLIDEIGWIKNFRDVWDAMEPIFSRDPGFRCALATTPPADDSHFAHELSVPPVGEKFEPSPAGHWYRSQAGIMVHRVDVFDAEAAGVHLYDAETRLPLTPAAHRAKSLDRESWDRNYALVMATSGTAACSALSLHAAQTHPLSPECIAVDTDEEIPEGWTDRVQAGATGAGIDLATTEGDQSNPAALAVVEQWGGKYIVRLIARWKTADPSRSRAIFQGVVDSLRHRKIPVRLRGMGIDATNERFFATDVRTLLAPYVSVSLVVASETASYRGQEMNTKEYLGNLLVNTLDDGQIILPTARWVREDFRLVKKKKGKFEAETDTNGGHGDCFDAVKLALDRLGGRGGPAEASAMPVGSQKAGGTESWLGEKARYSPALHA